MNASCLVEAPIQATLLLLSVLGFCDTDSLEEDWPGYLIECSIIRPGHAKTVRGILFYLVWDLLLRLSDPRGDELR